MSLKRTCQPCRGHRLPPLSRAYDISFFLERRVENRVGFNRGVLGGRIAALHVLICCPWIYGTRGDRLDCFCKYGLRARPLALLVQSLVSR